MLPIVYFCSLHQFTYIKIFIYIENIFILVSFLGDPDPYQVLSYWHGESAGELFVEVSSLLFL